MASNQNEQEVLKNTFDKIRTKALDVESQLWNEQHLRLEDTNLIRYLDSKIHANRKNAKKTTVDSIINASRTKWFQFHTEKHLTINDLDTLKSRVQSGLDDSYVTKGKYIGDGSNRTKEFLEESMKLINQAYEKLAQEQKPTLSYQ